jgi:hypothetical protein
VSKYQNSNDSGVKQAFQVLAQPLRAVHGLWPPTTSRRQQAHCLIDFSCIWLLSHLHLAHFTGLHSQRQNFHLITPVLKDPFGQTSCPWTATWRQNRILKHKMCRTSYALLCLICFLNPSYVFTYTSWSTIKLSLQTSGTLF